MIRPPTKKPMTAFRDGICRLLNPEIACPDVQPPAYRLPKPMSTPPMTNMNIILGYWNASLSGLDIKFAATNPPAIAPMITARFQRCARQSKLKNGTIFPAPAIEHKDRRFEDIPKTFPNQVSISITAPIKTPEMYQGQV